MRLFNTFKRKYSDAEVEELLAQVSDDDLRLTLFDVVYDLNREIRHWRSKSQYVTALRS